MALFSVILLGLSIAAHQAVCERYHIVTSPDSPCPGERNGVFCFTLQQFTSIYSRASQSLILELEPGIHVLESRLTITGISLIEIIGRNATIHCSPYYYAARLDFQSIEQVNISSITFVDCRRIYLYNVYNAMISASKFGTQLRPLSVTGLDIQTTNISIHSCTFIGQSTGVTLRSTNSSINSCDFFDNNRGVYLQQSMVTIFNTTFRDNRITSYGSAIYMHGGTSLLVTQSSFINNTASLSNYGGGAIYMEMNYFDRIESSLTIDRCIFANNTAYQGGALYMDISRHRYTLSRPSSCTIYRSVFINNQAISRGGAISADGNVSIVDSIFGYNTAPQCAVFANIMISSRQQLQQFESSIFLYNQATNSTAEDDNVQYLGGVACLRDSSLAVNNCTFSHNTAKDSGGVFHAEDSNITISRSSFHNNSAEIDGGVLYTYLLSSIFVLTECSFTNNRAGDDGGVIYIGKTRSTLDISRSSFSHNVANDRGGAIIVFGSTIGMQLTNMHNNEASSGDDIGVCTASNTSSLSSTYLAYFQQRTYSVPTTECVFYSRLTRVFNIPPPEDHSNTNLAQYLEIASQYESHNDILITTTSEVSSTLITTTDPERELLEDLRNKLSETSSMQYAILTSCLLFIVILVTVIIVKFKTCLKKKARSTEKYDLDKCHTSNEYNDNNESVEIYEEPVWKDDRPDAIRVKPNAGYAKRTF